MSKDLFRFRYFQLGETPLGFESGAEIPTTQTRFETLISKLASGEKPNFTFGGTKIADIAINNNLDRLTHDLMDFNNKNERFFINIQKKLALGSSFKGFTREKQIEFLQLVCLGIFGAESGYANDRYQKSEGSYKGPFQLTDPFIKDVKIITDETLICREIVDENQTDHEKYSLTRAKRILKNNARYYMILTGDTNIDLTTCNKSIIKSLKELNRKDPKDIPTLVSLQFERSIASNQRLIESEQIKLKFSKNPELRKIFLLIGYKEGLGEAGVFGEFIKSYRGDITNTEQILKKLIMHFKTKGYDLQKRDRIIQYIFHSYTHQWAQEHSTRKIYSVNGKPVDYHTQEQMDRYRTNHEKLSLNPHFKQPNILIINPGQDTEKEYTIHHHIDTRSKTPRSFIELRLKSHKLETFPLVKDRRGRLRRKIRRRELIDLNRELAQIVNPKGANLVRSSALQLQQKRRLKLQEGTILIDVYNLTHHASNSALKQTFRAFNKLKKAASKLTEEQAEVSISQTPKALNFKSLFQESRPQSTPSQSVAEKEAETTFENQTEEVKNSTIDNLQALRRKTYESNEQIRKSIIAQKALQKLKIKKPTSTQISTLLQVSQSITESEIKLKGIRINLKNIQDYSLAKPPIIKDTEIRLEYEDWGYNTVIHLKRDTQTGKWRRGSESYNDTGYEKEYISITRETPVIPPFKSIPRPRRVPASSNSNQNTERSTQETITEKRELTPAQEIQQNSRIINGMRLKITESMYPILKRRAQKKTTANKSDYLYAYGTNKIFIINKEIFEKYISLILTTQGNGNYKFPKRYVKIYTECMKETLNLERNEYAIPLFYIKDAVRPEQ